MVVLTFSNPLKKQTAKKKKTCSCDDDGWFRIGVNTCFRTIVESTVETTTDFIVGNGKNITIDKIELYSDPNGNSFLKDINGTKYFNPAMMIGSQLIKNNDKLILIDTAMGDLQSYVLVSKSIYDQSVEIGCENVDYVIHTHMHPDHIGGNTKYKDESKTDIIPTYQEYKTVHLIQYNEFEFWRNENVKNFVSFDKYIQPLIDNGKLFLTFNDYSITDNIHVQSCPGHTVGHQCIWLDSHCNNKNIKILFVGDLAHVPIQILNPSWDDIFDTNGTLNNQTRYEIIQTAFEHDIILSFAHFGYPNYGKIIQCPTCHGESGYAYQQLTLEELNALCNPRTNRSGHH